MAKIKKDKTLRFRVTEEEQRKILTYCEQAGINMTDLFRNRIIENRPERPKWLNERLHDIERDIMGMANNFNQLTKAFNSTEDEKIRTERMAIAVDILKTARAVLEEFKK